MTLSHATSGSAEASESSGYREDGTNVQQQQQLRHQNSISSGTTAATAGIGQQPPLKKKRNLPGTPAPDAEVISLSPKTLMATNRFVCEICGKGFQRDQNLQLHRRGHNLPWKLRQRTSTEPRKRVYVCPEPSCVHHDPSRALGDLTGIKKHFCRKHGEKKWKCDKCNKRYAVQSDWKAHSKTCGTREYRCDCGTLFSRRDSFITHRAFCDALAEENARVSASKQEVQQLARGFDGNMGATGSDAAQGPLIGGNSPFPVSYSTRMPGAAGDMPGVGMNGEELPWLPLKWGQANTVPGLGASAPAGPRLSLLLGSGATVTDPVAHNITGGSQLQSGDPISMNSMDGSASYLMQSMKNGHVGSEMYNTFGALEMEVPHGGGSTNFSNPFASGMGFPGISGSTLGQRGLSAAAEILDNRRSSTAGLSLSSSAGGFLGGSSPAAANGSSAFSSSAPNQQSQLPSSQMSATALLQKAAQMGATASNSSLLREFGMAGLDSGSFGLGAFWQPPPQDQMRANQSIHSSSTMARRPGDLSEFSVEGNNLTSSGYGAANRSAQQIGNQDVSSSTLRSFPAMFGSSLNGPGNGGSPIPSRSKQMTGAETGGSANNLFRGLFDPHMAAPMLPNHSVLPKSEDGADGYTRDFLGVSRAGGITGPTGRPGRTLSQRDLASLASMNASAE
ncbi:hypothetical protein O6H91_07G131900 [Diphasiastrum complanatum]|uniref:Uncharacterized protein n=1 Tax=Diphasiastrum complanatum TaxID=34168 RepID=A0ACC2D9M3_DIPCM|nr:hypothetical protein O6H91_07G131900 [Diphasiastrum complanatum]